MKIVIHNLDERHPGLTPGIAMGFREAAEVCLDRHHTSPGAVLVDRGKEINASVEWITPDARTKHAWANEIDTTEAGAYCVALAAVELTDDLVAVRRAETLVGADYYVAKKGTAVGDLENAYRLEVSGISEGNQSLVSSRLKQKLAQTARGRSSLPAIAAVVAFSPAQIAIADATQL